MVISGMSDPCNNQFLKVIALFIQYLRDEVNVPLTTLSLAPPLRNLHNPALQPKTLQLPLLA